MNTNNVESPVISKSDQIAVTVPEGFSLKAWRKYAYRLSGMLLLAAAIYYFLQQQALIVVEDASVDADIFVIRSHVDGLIIQSSYKEREQEVAQGTLLVALEGEEVSAQIAAIDAELNGIDNRIASVALEHQIQTHELTAERRKQELEKQRINKYLLQLALQRQDAQTDKARVDSLYAAGLLTVEQKDDSELNLQMQDIVLGMGELQEKLNQVRDEELNFKQQRLQLLLQEQRNLQHQREVLAANKQSLLVQKKHRAYLAPVSGVIDDVFVLPGEYVSQGDRLFMMHSRDSIRIVARVYEDQLGSLYQGKSASIKLDAYSGREFIGTVKKFGSVTQSKRAVIAPTQVISNFIKIRQQVRVELAIDAPDISLVPGMMAVVTFEK